MSLVLVVTACGGRPAAVEPMQLYLDSPVEIPVVGTPDPTKVGNWMPQYEEVGGLRRFAYTDGDRFVIATEDGTRDFVAGTNIGPTIPGHFPGEQAIRREDFQRWFPMMRDLGIQAIRVYTIMPPHFYEELAAFNTSNPTRPLLVIHGVWIPEQPFYQKKNLYDTELIDQFQEEMDRAVAIVHGDASLPDRPGHAWGDYTADISPWLLAWAMGIEWDPTVIAASEQANGEVDPYEGRYFEATKGATSTESWMAQMLDHLASLEAARGVTMPLTFVNWPTTDPLQHPEEPLETEDLVGIDANNVRPTDEWTGGYFASYHAYPYYPDFQRYEPGIADFEVEGRRDAYAGYLTKLRDHHNDIPVMITEYAVPSGMAFAHFGPEGRNQGGHSEQQQMAINAELLNAIRDVGLAGAFQFEWADEWFKFTWNTIDYEIPWQRRSLWMNPWTNEAHFGLVSVDPGDERVAILDGDETEWETNESQVILESRGSVRQVRAVKDEGFLYLKIRTNEAESWLLDPIVVGIDVLDGGGGPLPHVGAVDPSADHVVVVGPGEEAAILVRASNDPYLVQYGLALGYEEVDLGDVEEGSGVWNVQRLVVNKPLTIPSTGQWFGAEVIEPGRLVFGTSDPDDPKFDSRTTWAAAGTAVEIRLPYQAIGIADPSSLQAYRIGEDGEISTESFERVGITITHQGEHFETGGYAWEPWQSVSWHERLKVGVDIFASAVIAANSR